MSQYLHKSGLQGAPLGLALIGNNRLGAEVSVINKRGNLLQYGENASETCISQVNVVNLNVKIRCCISLQII